MFPSGQRGQTVNLLAMPTVVRIHPPPPEKGPQVCGPFSFFARCAKRARLKVSSTFSKVVESRGKASGRAPQSAELSLCSHKRRRGSKGEPSPGVPPFLFFSLPLYVCAVFLGSVLWPLLPIPPHFFALAQRNGVEPQRNALKGAATGAVGSRPPLPRTRSPNITADCVKLT